MNPIAPATEKTSRPAYMLEVDRCLTRRDELLSILGDVIKIAPWLRHDAQTNSLVSALKRAAPAEEFVSSRRLAQCLPLVLMMRDVDGSQERLLIIQRMRTYLQHAYRRRWIWQLLSYPVILIVAYVITWVLLSLTLLPAFLDLYEGLDLRKNPANQRWLERSARWATHPFQSTIGTLAYCAVLIGIIKAIPYGLEYGSGWWFIGNITRSSKRQLLAMSRLTGTMAALVRIGAPISDALRIAGLASGYHLFRENASLAAVAWERSGGQVRLPLCFPETLDFALNSPRGVCEVELIEKLSAIYTQRLERRIELGRNLAGPIATVVGGFFIGGLYANFMSPLLQLITSLS